MHDFHNYRDINLDTALPAFTMDMMRDHISSLSKANFDHEACIKRHLERDILLFRQCVLHGFVFIKGLVSASKKKVA